MALNIIDEGQNNFVSIAENANLQGSVVIKGDNNRVVIGPTERPGRLHIMVASGCDLAIGENFGFGELVIYLVAKGCRFSIGAGLCVNGSVQLTMHEPGRLSIGADCLFASGASFQTSDVHGLFDIETGARINHSRDIEVGDHVWIGAGAVILKGARIGSGSVVAIRGLVSGVVPPCSVAAGVPARIIKSGVTWHQQAMERMPAALQEKAAAWAGFAPPALAESCPG